MIINERESVKALAAKLVTTAKFLPHQKTILTFSWVAMAMFITILAASFFAYQFGAQQTLLIAQITQAQATIF